jgi:hypothetical protein
MYIAYVCHVLHRLSGAAVERQAAQERGSDAPDPRTGVTESSYDHVVLYSGGVNLIGSGSWVLKWPILVAGLLGGW